MLTLDRHHPLARCMATLLACLLAVGASGAPPGAYVACDTCARDLVGNVVCARPTEVPGAAAHSCCKSADADGAVKPDQLAAHRPAPAGGDDCASHCSQCCAPASRAPAVAAVAPNLPSPAPRLPAPPASAPTTPPAAVHHSIFHPPRA